MRYLYENTDYYAKVTQDGDYYGFDYNLPFDIERLYFTKGENVLWYRSGNIGKKGNVSLNPKISRCYEP